MSTPEKSAVCSKSRCQGYYRRGSLELPLLFHGYGLDALLAFLSATFSVFQERLPFQKKAGYNSLKDRK
jgi:hypothetical protein